MTSSEIWYHTTLFLWSICRLLEVKIRPKVSLLNPKNILRQVENNLKVQKTTFLPTENWKSPSLIFKTLIIILNLCSILRPLGCEKVVLLSPKIISKQFLDNSNSTFFNYGTRIRGQAPEHLGPSWVGLQRFTRPTKPQ